MITIKVILWTICTIAVIVWTINEHKKHKNRGLWGAGVIISAGLFFITISAVSDNYTYLQQQQRYADALALMEEGDYYNAYLQLEELYDETGPRKLDNITGNMQYAYDLYNYEFGMDCYEFCDWLGGYYYFNECIDYLDARLYADYCYCMYLYENYPNWIEHIPDINHGGIPIYEELIIYD